MAKDQRRCGSQNSAPTFYVEGRDCSLPRGPAHRAKGLLAGSPLADAIVNPKVLHAWATPVSDRPDIVDITQLTSPAHSLALSELAAQFRFPQVLFPLRTLPKGHTRKDFDPKIITSSASIRCFEAATLGDASCISSVAN